MTTTAFTGLSLVLLLVDWYWLLSYWNYVTSKHRHSSGKQAQGRLSSQMTCNSHMHKLNVIDVDM